MSSDPREAIALLRYRIVAAATDPQLTPTERGQLVRELAVLAYDHPDGSHYTYSRGRLDRWVRASGDQGLDGLRPWRVRQILRRQRLKRASASPYL